MIASQALFHHPVHSSSCQTKCTHPTGYAPSCPLMAYECFTVHCVAITQYEATSLSRFLTTATQHSKRCIWHMFAKSLCCHPRQLGFIYGYRRRWWANRVFNGNNCVRGILLNKETLGCQSADTRIVVIAIKDLLYLVAGKVGVK